MADTAEVEKVPPEYYRSEAFSNIINVICVAHIGLFVLVCCPTVYRFTDSIHKPSCDSCLLGKKPAKHAQFICDTCQTSDSRDLSDKSSFIFGSGVTTNYSVEVQILLHALTSDGYSNASGTRQQIHRFGIPPETFEKL
ncbi:hypothetical protein BJ508DRAFT_306798 [Ascobolus immersus RN42]|uniref:Uncharacterized protein n=1 Tax=Ascobolus immersus RN42 TaxID=1160509 RepID=A0A3N4I4U5_ASCIM|nr:hypothetical protein BJ508DRAFT_306798 [Ascobolus immersus RN42]